MTAEVRLVNISNIPWVSGRLKRNQAIFTQLLATSAVFHEGLFVNPPIIRGSGLSKYCSGPVLELLGYEDVRHKRITILQPRYSLPYWHIDFMSTVWATSVAKHLLALLTDRRYVLWMNSAGKLQAAVAPSIANGAAYRVFDSSDDFTSWERGPAFRRQLQRVLSLADIVVCVNDHVAGTLAHRRKIVFRNCTDVGTLQSEPVGFCLPPYFPKPPKAIYIGFTGGLHSTRADEQLLQRLFQRFSDYQFLFIGSTDCPDFVRRIACRENVRVLSEVPYRYLGSIIRSFDVAIVPHVDNAVTRGNDLLKVLDYFACGVPVVATKCSNVEEYGAALYVAEGAEEFGRYIELLISKKLKHNPEPGYSIVRERDWSVQVPRLANDVFAGLRGEAARDDA